MSIPLVLLSFIRTFAAVKMAKRQISSWLLLAVFVPMLLLSSLHIHGYVQTADDECAECVHHHCGGHIGQQTLSLDDCLLCQFLTLPMAVATCIVAVTLLINAYRLTFGQRHDCICTHVLGVVVTRGPPVLVIKN